MCFAIVLPNTDSQFFKFDDLIFNVFLKFDFNKLFVQGKVVQLFVLIKFDACLVTKFILLKIVAQELLFNGKGEI